MCPIHGRQQQQPFPATVPQPSREEAEALRNGIAQILNAADKDLNECLADGDYMSTAKKMLDALCAMASQAAAQGVAFVNRGPGKPMPYEDEAPARPDHIADTSKKVTTGSGGGHGFGTGTGTVEIAQAPAVATDIYRTKENIENTVRAIHDNRYYRDDELNRIFNRAVESLKALAMEPLEIATQKAASAMCGSEGVAGPETPRCPKCGTIELYEDDARYTCSRDDCDGELVKETGDNSMTATGGGCGAGGFINPCTIKYFPYEQPPGSHICASSLNSPCPICGRGTVEVPAKTPASPSKTPESTIDVGDGYVHLAVGTVLEATDQWFHIHGWFPMSACSSEHNIGKRIGDPSVRACPYRRKLPAPSPAESGEGEGEGGDRLIEKYGESMKCVEACERTVRWNRDERKDGYGPAHLQESLDKLREAEDRAEKDCAALLSHIAALEAKAKLCDELAEAVKANHGVVSETVWMPILKKIAEGKR